MQDDDDSTAVTVNLENAAAGYTYTLTLTPTGMVDGTAFPCTYASGDCTATVTGLAEGTYGARVQVTESVSGASFITGTVASAFQVNAASGGGGTCAAPSCMNTGGETCTCTTASNWSLVCDDFQCECRNGASLVGDGPSAGVCGSVSSMQATFADLCEPCSD
jgi:hypothetical protein